MRYNCGNCENENTIECDDCSILDGEGCSCHINPPCGFCENNHYEEKRRWDDIAIDEGKIKS
jgi:hypothetical protein